MHCQFDILLIWRRQNLVKYYSIEEAAIESTYRISSDHAIAKVMYILIVTVPIFCLLVNEFEAVIVGVILKLDTDVYC